jgi:hypothetical protein
MIFSTFRLTAPFGEELRISADADQIVYALGESVSDFADADKRATSCLVLAVAIIQGAPSPEL